MAKTAPTLIIGLGGKGIQIVELIAERAAAEGARDVEFVVMDTDVNDLRRVRANHANIRTIQTSPRGIVGAALDTNPFARDRWFPLNSGLMGKPFTEGAGQVRAVSRLAFDHAVEQGYMRELEVAIEQLRGLSRETMRQEMRIMICGSIAGGTGSGILLPVALFVRNYLITRYQDDSAIIRGYFLQPDTLFDVIKDEEERNSLRCNAYATIRELDAFFRKEYTGDGPEFRHVVFNAPQPGMTERMDYPNILPYHFVFLMDAINAAGERLDNSQAYVEHIADIIYAQTLSAGSARSNSAEDNVIRLLSASSGRSRYCGAGCSYLEYPVEAVQRFIGLGWASKSISAEWMEIDRDYERLEREGKAGDRDQHYVTFFDTHRDAGGFYEKASRGTTRTIREGNTVVESPIAEYFREQLESHAELWNDTGLANACKELRSFEDNESVPAAAPSDVDSVHSAIESHGGAKAGGRVLGTNLDALYSYNRRHFGIVSGAARRAARDYADMSFRISEGDRNPLASRTEDWQLERYIDNEGQTLHPSGVRYLLSSIILDLTSEVEQAKEDCDSKEEAIRKALDGDFYDATEEKEDVQTAVAQILAQDGGTVSPFTKVLSVLPGRGAGLSEEAEGNLASIGETLNQLTSDIEALRQLIVTYEFLSAALAYVKRLAAAYRQFYGFLGEQISDLDNEVDAILHDGDFNNERGVTRRYVCASTECLRKMRGLCRQKGDAGDIPADLCADIYRGLLRYTTLMHVTEEEREESVREKKRSFGRLYERTVKDFWIKRVMDPGDGYPQIVDKNIIRAILDEARYLNPEEATDPERGQAYLEAELERAFDQAHHIATPFIEPPVGENPRNIGLCVYSEEIFEGAGEVAPKLRTILSDHNGSKIAAGECDKHQIMFYRSMYGFCATNLPKYAPEHKGMQQRPEGEYHRVYWDMVKQLSPDLSANKLITPHIDRNWHLVSYLPDINDDYEAQLKSEIMHAFIFGLTSKQFGGDFASNGNLFYLTARRGASRVDLTVSNGTRCDHFYEVFDALKFNPPVVYELLARSAKSLSDEREHAVTLAPETSRLVQNIRSHAFADGLDAQGVYARIAAYAGDADALLGKSKYGRQEANEFLAQMVTNMFNTRDVSGSLVRRSIFEIPVFYKISLPHTETRVGEIDSMLDGILDAVVGYFTEFCDPSELQDVCERFFEEQYLLFERNLVELDARFPGCGNDRTANTVRDKVLSFFDLSSETGERLWETKQGLDTAWGEVSSRRRKLQAESIKRIEA